ncbi:MAG: hypothetical protein ABR507_06700 [Actinomycetota bacterium]|nr:hypothetical protein [Actinomycetota bacterium]
MTARESEILKALKRIGARGAHFQFGDLRKALGVSSGDQNAAARTFQIFSRLIREGMVEVVPGKRKSYKYYRLAEDAVQERLGANGRRPAQPARPMVSPQVTLSALELGIHQVLDRLDQIETRLEELASAWS